ncbi:MAG TPA: outer membrane beta-barrel protein [Puia sp.]|nr:outer membrane beta-barrel protein [Puia sp.]
MKQRLRSVLRKCFYTLVIILALHAPSYSQLSVGNYFEAGFTAGPMVFLGDLGGNAGVGTTFIKDYNIPATRLSLGAFVAAHPAEWVGFRLAVNWGELYGNDNLIKAKGGEQDSRYNRNLDFRTQITEGYVGMELYPTVFIEDDPTSVFGRLRPYGMIGVGVFHFNPQGTYTDASGNSEWVYLRPLHTEGEGFAEYPGRKEYSLTQLNIPMAVGVKYYFSDNLNLSFEVLYRKTFTDYIDDVSTTYIDPSLFSKYLSPGDAQIAAAIYNKSPLRGIPASGYNPGDQRGNSANNDAYFTFGFKIAFRLAQGREWRNSTHCPLLRF